MKKVLGLFTIAFALMFGLMLNVNAAEVGSAGDLNSCLGQDTECTLTQDITADVKVPAGKTVTIDLNGHNLTNATAKDTIYVEMGATLTIKGEGIVTNTKAGYSPLFNNGTVIINGGTFQRDVALDNVTNKHYIILNHGIMTINNATVTVLNEDQIPVGETRSSLIENGYYNYSEKTNERKGYVVGTNHEEPTLTINGGTFIGGLNTVKNDENGILEINNGTFSNTAQVSLLNANVATINGGTFNTPTGKDKTNISVKDYGIPTATGVLTINGGTFNAENVLEGAVTTPVEINGGTFNYTVSFVNNSAERQAKNDNLDTAGNVEVVGGTFASDVTKYLGANVDKVEVDGVYYVGASYKVTLAKVENGKVTLSTETAVAGQPVELTIEANKGYKLVKAVYVGADDKEVEIKDGKFAMPDEDVTVKVTFEKETAAKGDVIPPKTGDNTAIFMVLGIIGLMGAAVTAKKLRNN